ncbi:MAG: hypothetical protein ACLU99_04200 [Alphaproteobacteria bacterium]
MEILGRNNRQRVLQQRSYNTRAAKKSGKQPEPTLLETDLCPQKTEKTKIIDYLNHSGVYVDEIIRASGLDAATVSWSFWNWSSAEKSSGNRATKWLS